jgi:hypothetical protein
VHLPIAKPLERLSMVKRLALFCLFVLLPHMAAADSIVTWQATGEVEFSAFAGRQDTGRVPVAGTPYSLTMTLSPSSAVPTGLSPEGSNCNMVTVNALLTLGGFNYSMGGFGFTHARLPGTNCAPGTNETQYIMGFREPRPDTPWPMVGFGFMELWYTDLVEQDLFPDAPTHNGGGFQIRDETGAWIITARHDLHALQLPEQPVPVPEPGTLTLFGLGLAAVARKVRQARSQRR